MPTLYDVKPRFQALLRPAAARLAAGGVTANQLTVAAILLCLLAGLLLLVFPGSRLVLFLLVPVLLARMALNALDGMLAREHGQASRLGLVLNEAGDVLGDAALYLPLAVALAPFGVAPAAVVAFAFAGLIAEFVGVLGPQLGGARRYDGPLGKSDRALLVGFVALWLAVGLAGGDWLTLLFWVLAAAGLLTAWNRGRAAFRRQ